MAGLKHMDVLQGRADQVCGEIQRMAPDEVEKTYDFISSLIGAQRGAETATGRIEKLLEHRGKWTFNEGERGILIEELARMRKGERG
jgi:hypothetical protein